jgi:hypothetical protein
MKAANDTTKAINQGFALGVHADVELEELGAVLTVFLQLRNDYFRFYCTKQTVDNGFCRHSVRQILFVWE